MRVNWYRLPSHSNAVRYLHCLATLMRKNALRRSIRAKYLAPATLCRRSCRRGRGQSKFLVTAFAGLQSMQVRMEPFFFATKTGLLTHMMRWQSSITPSSNHCRVCTLSSKRSEGDSARRRGGVGWPVSSGHHSYTGALGTSFSSGSPMPCDPSYHSVHIVAACCGQQHFLAPPQYSGLGPVTTS